MATAVTGAVVPAGLAAARARPVTGAAANRFRAPITVALSGKHGRPIGGAMRKPRTPAAPPATDEVGGGDEGAAAAATASGEAGANGAKPLTKQPRGPTVMELRKQLSSRGLPTRGSKLALIARLEGRPEPEAGPADAAEDSSAEAETAPLPTEEAAAAAEPPKNEEMEAKIQHFIRTGDFTSLTGEPAPRPSLRGPDAEEARLVAELASVRSQLAVREAELGALAASLEVAETQLMELRELNIGQLRAANDALVGRNHQLADAYSALGRLQAVTVEWWGTAGSVSICGAFDGWTNQAPMMVDAEASAGSGSGAKKFTADLFLYPGTYEYKFIVDGKWQVDARKDVVKNKSGHENNVLHVTGPQGNRG